jgi:hypothetical protein
VEFQASLRIAASSNRIVGVKAVFVAIVAAEVVVIVLIVRVYFSVDFVCDGAGFEC